MGNLGDGRAGVGGQGDEGFLGHLVLSIEGPDRLPVAVFLGDEGVFHGLARINLNVMAIDVDGVPWRDLAPRDQALAQDGLEVQTMVDGDTLEKAVLGGWRREKRETSEEAKVGAAHRIDGSNASGIAEN
jgi:hypothetical protein